MSYTVPPPAEPGDRVAVLAPSSGAAHVAPDVLALGLQRLREQFDLEPVLYPTARQSDAFLAAHPEARAADVHAALRDPDVAAVFATIGGDDQVRVLRHLDPGVLAAHPTRFFGMSDNTCLHAALSDAGVVSYYGGQVLNQLATPGELPAYTREHVHRALFDDSLGVVEPADAWTDDVVSWHRDDYADASPEYEDSDGYTWTGGDRRVEGRLWGGCLGVLQWLLAADRAVPDPGDLAGDVLFLETSEERPTAVEVRRTLTCMGERGLLAAVDAVLVARPQTRDHREDPGPRARREYREQQRETVRETVDRYNPGVPVVFDLDAGHTNPNVPLPVGGRVRVDARDRVIEFPG